jgi:hypothetical protein
MTSALMTSPFIYKEWWVKMSNKIKPYWSIDNLDDILGVNWKKQKCRFMDKVRLRTRTLYVMDVVLLFINLRGHISTSMQQNRVLSHVSYRFISSISFVHQKLFLNLTISYFSFQLKEFLLFIMKKLNSFLQKYFYELFIVDIDW